MTDKKENVIDFQKFVQDIPEDLKDEALKEFETMTTDAASKVFNEMKGEHEKAIVMCQMIACVCLRLTPLAVKEGVPLPMLAMAMAATVGSALGVLIPASDLEEGSPAELVHNSFMSNMMAGFTHKDAAISWAATMAGDQSQIDKINSQLSDQVELFKGLNQKLN